MVLNGIPNVTEWGTGVSWYNGIGWGTIVSCYWIGGLLVCHKLLDK